MDKMQRMKELIPMLTEAAKAYYQEDREIMSNFEYDRLYDELVKLEEETGVTLARKSYGLCGICVIRRTAERGPRKSYAFPG